MKFLIMILILAILFVAGCTNPLEGDLLPAPVPNQTQEPENQLTCTESWSCTDWSICGGGTQTRTCTDTNRCGTTDNKSNESQNCIPCPSSCDDENGCTYDYCNETTNHQCTHDTIIPCCGNSICESNEIYSNCSLDCEKTSLQEELENKGYDVTDVERNTGQFQELGMWNYILVAINDDRVLQEGNVNLNIGWEVLEEIYPITRVYYSDSEITFVMLHNNCQDKMIRCEKSIPELNIGSCIWEVKSAYNNYGKYC